MAKRFLPDHTFDLQPWHAAGNFERMPSIAAMAHHVEPSGVKSVAMGIFLADVAAKLLRPFPVYGDQPFAADTANCGILNILVDLCGVSLVMTTFLQRLDELLQIALNQPGRLPEIARALDALTNERLTERGRSILETGIDPGADDLWQSHGGRHE